MKKGISTWLLTKVVMLVFLTMTFAILISFAGLVEQRALSESAQHLSMRVTDSAQSLLGIKAESGSQCIVLPERIPRDTDRAISYTMDIYKTNQNTLVVTVARGTYDTNIPEGNYIAGTSFKLPQGYDLEIGNGEGVLLPSEKYNFVIVSRQGKSFTVMGCDASSCEEC